MISIYPQRNDTKLSYVHNLSNIEGGSTIHTKAIYHLKIFILLKGHQNDTYLSINVKYWVSSYH